MGIVLAHVVAPVSMGKGPRTGGAVGTTTERGSGTTTLTGATGAGVGTVR